MEENLVKQLNEIVDTGSDDMVKELQQVLSATESGAMTVRAVRDTFTKVLTRVRSGEMQLIGRKTEDMAVMISLKDLAALIQASSRGLSFGSALDEMGFQPLGRRITVRKPRNHVPLKRPSKLAPAASMGR
jgi:antitoxin (DNA-binding transcriptional repressor) of toxin-antitoxin stability system